MVGGVVITTIDVSAKSRIYINCQGTGQERRETCAIYVERNSNSLAVRPGDWIWWQCGNAYWTPTDKRFKERAIPRIGYSGVKSPLASQRG